MQVQVREEPTTVPLVPTGLLIPNDYHDEEQEEYVPLYLPKKQSQPRLDDYIQSQYPQLYQDILDDEQPYVFDSATTSERLLYVGQGERANTTSHESDIIMSDKATTCHILAFHSTTTTTTTSDLWRSSSHCHL